MKKARRLVTLLMTLVIMASLFIGPAPAAGAANVCTMISGSAKRPTTFKVTTEKCWLGDKITLKQSKGTARFTSWTGREKTKDIYGSYTVYIRKTSGGNSKADVRTVEWKNSKTFSIKLQKNATYTITVEPLDDAYTLLTRLLNGVFDSWKSYPSWSVSKTRGVSLCS